MSISAASCHYYQALNVSGAPVNPSVISIFAWIKADANGWYVIAPFVMDSGDDWSSERRRVGLRSTGAHEVQGWAQTSWSTDGIANNSAIYFYEGTSQGKWTGAGMWMDLPASSADCGALVGRAVATAVAATTSPAAYDFGSMNATLNDFYALRHNNEFYNIASDATSTLRMAHLAVWVGYKLTTSDMQSLVDGTNPQDIGTGYLEYYWPLTTSTVGLTDEIASVTLTPTGGSATSTFYDSDNPTVNAPTGGSTSYTITIDAGTYTISGESLATPITVVLNVGNGTYTITGSDVSLGGATTYTITLDVGSYNIESFAPVINIALGLDTGDYSSTGADVALSTTTGGGGTSYSFALDTGIYQKTGQDLGTILAYVMQLDQGNYLNAGKFVRLVSSTEPVILTNGNHTISISIKIGI